MTDAAKPFHAAAALTLDLTSDAATAATEAIVAKMADPNIAAPQALMAAVAAADYAAASAYFATLAAWGLDTEHEGVTIDYDAGGNGGFHHEGGVTVTSGALADAAATPVVDTSGGTSEPAPAPDSVASDPVISGSQVPTPTDQSASEPAPSDGAATSEPTA